MFSTSMPNFATSAALVESATKCLATAASLPSLPTSHSRAESALVIVSWVVKVLEATMKSVCSALTSRSVSARWVESTLETKKHLIERLPNGVRAMFAITGPRSLPPMPMLTTYLMRLPVKPRWTPLRTASAKAPIFESVALTSGITSLPSTNTFASGSTLRSAVWRTARFSVRLIFSPVNIRSISSLRPDASARPRSAFITAASTRFLE